ncbi:hypothetical protein A2W14_02025 [Candidatus Gottesmanbacteria bacterium RBG_16_37_8]|uniref:Uncharacterized protein n=1 Tax=Candidatus Gottesmanbacteria bacterium RBG_16_37_8 TaxID=1798371 RepID=A0A1F5YRX9_9BACT|nr:MAG: hypothetical protein A2W14_02025 [Candidatus Gottesmanbacteria bacterium RBG_16_37_8]
MDVSYLGNRNNKNFMLPVIIVVVVILLAGVGFVVFKSRSKFISPLPDEPAVEIIFYTPTPEPVTPTSSPSATPRSQKKASPTITPTNAVTATPTNKP